MSFWDSFVILLCLGELCLLVLFPFGIVLLVLLAGPPLGGCQFLVVLLIWLLLVLVLCGRLLLMVVLVQDGKGFDLTDKPLLTSRVSWFNLRHVCGRDCIMWGIQLIHMLIVRWGVVISMTKGMFLINSGLEWDDSRDECSPTSPGLHVWN